MTINNPNAFFDSQWDWACLDGCFGESKIKPSDIDGFVERKSRFLVLETKLPGTVLPEGQERTFKALADTGLFTILVVWGKSGNPVKLHMRTRRGLKVVSDPSIEALRNTVKQWYKFADYNPLPNGLAPGVIAMASFIMYHYTKKERLALAAILMQE